MVTPDNIYETWPKNTAQDFMSRIFKNYFLFLDDDCLQYYTGTSGSFSSFNYDTTVSNAAMTTANTHLANQNYNICFR